MPQGKRRRRREKEGRSQEEGKKGGAGRWKRGRRGARNVPSADGLHPVTIKTNGVFRLTSTYRASSAATLADGPYVGHGTVAQFTVFVRTRMVSYSSGGRQDRGTESESK